MGIPKWIRVFIIIPAALVAEIPVLYRMTTGTATWEAMLVLVMMGGGVVLYSQHFPERMRPELFDCGFYSHPIWHTCYISANYYDVLALLQDYCAERRLEVKMCNIHSNELSIYFWAPIILVSTLLALALLRIYLTPKIDMKVVKKK